MSYSQKKFEINNTNKLDELKIKYKNCKKCPLSNGRTNFVYGEGNPKAKLLIIGEGPGEEEDKTGKPFVGPAGQLLTKMLKAIKLERHEVYIANIVKCRPPFNRNPLPMETSACLPYLIEQIELIQPKLLLLLGKVAANTLFKSADTLGNYRQRELYYKEIRTFVTYHPSALLRHAEWKRPAWEDLQKLQKEYQKL